jgi:hypothetical protein
MVDIQGSPRTYFVGETYTNNGEACNEAIHAYSTNTNIMTVAGAASSMQTMVNSPGTYSSSTLMTSMIQVTRTAYVSMINMTFNGNYLIEP